MHNHRILAIETSCDETAAAVYTTTEGLLSHTLFSQITLHQQYGGVVPEIASRSHIEKIDCVVDTALQESGLCLDDITAVAVTTRPGLPGSLLVGLCFAKALAYARGLDLIGINHLEGHAYSGFLEHAPVFPYLCLTASGGHTSMYYVTDYGAYTELGATRDDAAGEACDKIAHLIGLGYPGGPHIEKTAKKADDKDWYHYPRMRKPGCHFSFSGLKTAVLYDLVERGLCDFEQKRCSTLSDQEQARVASSLQHAIGDIFLNRLEHAYQSIASCKALHFVGGVACNEMIANKLGNWAHNKGLSFVRPSRKYCTDNAAMIAFVAHYRLCRGERNTYDLDIFKKKY